jgi:hypothetical protein
MKLCLLLAAMLVMSQASFIKELLQQTLEDQTADVPKETFLQNVYYDDNEEFQRLDGFSGDSCRQLDKVAEHLSPDFLKRIPATTNASGMTSTTFAFRRRRSN